MYSSCLQRLTSARCVFTVSKFARFQHKRTVMCVANLTFEVSHTNQQARVGVLKHARGQLETPAILIYTKRGSPMFLTPDMMSHLGPEGQCYILDGTKL